MTSIFESACVDTGCMITVDMTGDGEHIKELKKIQKVRNDLKLKSKSELLIEIAEKDRKPKPFIIYLSDSEEEEVAGTISSMNCISVKRIDRVDN